MGETNQTSMILILFLLVASGLLVWVFALREKVIKLTSRLQPFEAIEGYVRTARRSADIEISGARKEASEIIENARREALRIANEARIESDLMPDKSDFELENARKEASEIIENARRESVQLREEIEFLRAEAKAAKDELALLDESLRLKVDDVNMLQVGYYQPTYGFESLSEYNDAILEIKNEQKAMLSAVSGKPWFLRKDINHAEDFCAVIVREQVSYNGSDAQGEKLLLRVQQLMLRAFNGECDALIARVNYRNFAAIEKRIRSAFGQIDKIGKYWHCELFTGYLDNRIAELRLVYEYAELKEKIKREQAAIREQMREEEKAARDAERAIKQLEEQRLEYERQLAAEKDKAKIEELQRIIGEITSKERAVSQAQLTRAGHVYILSNVGSFGEDVFKIGMTRREDPVDRVKELGDASVPFPFDVHAMIATKDAPTLERALHNHFSQRRVNLENERKEFFRLSIQEIKEELQRLKDSLGIESEIQLSLLAEAKEYRQSEARRNYLLQDG